MLKKYNPELFLRQEDWLFTFQHFMLNQIDNEYFGIGKSVDCNSKNLVDGNAKAKWGLDILFKKSLNSSVSQLSEFSSPRIQIIKLDLDIPIIIINVYLPSTSCPESEYDTELAGLSAAIDTLATQRALLLAGDFNRSLHRNNPSEKKFHEFCHSEGLTPDLGTNSYPSYHGYNNATSRIDYIYCCTQTIAPYLA